jgi:adenylate cyclase
MLGPQAFIGLLNRYFDCQVPEIEAHGGEVLKFMGDGLLAIFPVAGEDAPVTEVCRHALSAARSARANVAAIAGADRLGFGVALHIGRVLYGNIGSGNRLDFTCIGAAVNLAARIETLSRELQQTILASSAFAEHCAEQLEPIGVYRLPGIAAEQAV